MTDVSSLRVGEPHLIHDARFEIGEGPFWHPERQRLFSFSILEGLIVSHDADGGNVEEWRLGERAAAAAIVDRDTLLVATETGLKRLDLISGEKLLTEPVEADDPRTRSNDSRAAPDGSFWFSTMGLAHEDGLGAIYRYKPGGSPPVSVIERHVSIPNAICFAPDGSFAYWCDTTIPRIMRVALDANGGPAGDSEVHIELDENLNPDGAVVDAEGCLWNAQWGASRVARYDPAGRFMDEVRFPVSQVSCPAFGGPDMTTLFVTTAYEGLSEGEREPHAGSIFAVETNVRGVPEPRVALPGSSE